MHEALLYEGNKVEFPTCEKQKKIEKTHAKQKQSHAQDNIYVVRQFAYVHGVAEISLLSGKNIECNHSGYNIFSLYITWQPHHTKKP